MLLTGTHCVNYRSKAMSALNSLIVLLARASGKKLKIEIRVVAVYLKLLNIVYFIREKIFILPRFECSLSKKIMLSLSMGHKVLQYVSPDQRERKSRPQSI